MKPLAIPLGCQKATAKWLVMAVHPKDGGLAAGYDVVFLQQPDCLIAHCLYSVCQGEVSSNPDMSLSEVVCEL